jgi:hypothetical protein
MDLHKKLIEERKRAIREEGYPPYIPPALRDLVENGHQSQGSAYMLHSLKSRYPEAYRYLTEQKVQRRFSL